MSREALSWVIDQRAATGGMQMLLTLLALRADETGGMTRLSIPYLAEHSRQSERSVSRQLAELEKEGVFEREISRSPAGGVIIIGKLRLDRKLAMACESERNAAADRDAKPESDAMPKTHASEDNISEEPKGENEDGERPAIMAGRDVPPLCPSDPPLTTERPAIMAGPPYIRNLQESLSNAGAGAREAEKERAAAFQKRLDEDWRRFCEAYPTSAAMDLVAAKRELGELLLGDRDKAIRFAADYAAALKAGGRTMAKDAWRWLSERQFDALAERAAATVAQLPPDKRFTVQRPTPAGQAWDAYDRERAKLGFPGGVWFFSAVVGCEISRRATLFPPKAEDASDEPPQSATGPPDDDVSF